LSAAAEPGACRPSMAQVSTTPISPARPFAPQYLAAEAW
jgi:hypothetical protein